MNIEKLEFVLHVAAKNGLIKSYRRETSDDPCNPCREFYIVGNLNDHYTIVWYTNLMTLKSRTMELWFDGISITHSHPCYEGAIAFYNNTTPIAHIGEKYDHLKDVEAGLS